MNLDLRQGKPIPAPSSAWTTIDSKNAVPADLDRKYVCLTRDEFQSRIIDRYSIKWSGLNKTQVVVTRLVGCGGEKYARDQIMEVDFQWKPPTSTLVVDPDQLSEPVATVTNGGHHYCPLLVSNDSADSTDQYDQLAPFVYVGFYCRKYDYSVASRYFYYPELPLEVMLPLEMSGADGYGSRPRPHIRNDVWLRILEGGYRGIPLPLQYQHTTPDGLHTEGITVVDPNGRRVLIRGGASQGELASGNRWCTIVDGAWITVDKVEYGVRTYSEYDGRYLHGEVITCDKNDHQHMVTYQHGMLNGDFSYTKDANEPHGAYQWVSAEGTIVQDPKISPNDQVTTRNYSKVDPDTYDEEVKYEFNPKPALVGWYQETIPSHRLIDEPQRTVDYEQLPYTDEQYDDAHELHGVQVYHRYRSDGAYSVGTVKGKGVIEFCFAETLVKNTTLRQRFASQFEPVWKYTRWFWRGTEYTSDQFQQLPKLVAAVFVPSLSTIILEY